MLVNLEKNDQNIEPLGMRPEGYSSCRVCLSLCLSVSYQSNGSMAQFYAQTKV